ncbi:unnamed protein product, partial [Didymodactylos carnosus]
LDVRSNIARYNQAQLLKNLIIKKQKQYSHLPTILTGDFNSVPGHKAYSILTKILSDVWISSTIEKQKSYSISTYHHWYGARVNSYLARSALYLAFTWHGLFDYNINFMFPNSFKRYHVDWILYAQPIDNDKNNSYQIYPRFVTVGDVRYSNYSSDHFPVIAIFELN